MKRLTSKAMLTRNTAAATMNATRSFFESARKIIFNLSTFYLEYHRFNRHHAHCPPRFLLMSCQLPERQHCKDNTEHDRAPEDKPLHAAAGLIKTRFTAKDAGKSRRAFLQEDQDDQYNRNGDLSDRENHVRLGGLVCAYLCAESLCLFSHECVYEQIGE